MTLAIYARTGRVIYRKRRELHQLGTHESGFDLEVPCEPVSSKVTEIHITSERSHICGHITCPDMVALNPMCPRDILSPYDPYSVTIEGGPSSERNNSISTKPTRHEHHEFAHRRSVGTDANRAAWVYTKYAMLFFIALIITWVSHHSYLWHEVYQIAECGCLGPLHHQSSLCARLSRQFQLPAQLSFQFCASAPGVLE